MDSHLQKCIDYIEWIAKKVLRVISALLHRDFDEEAFRNFAQFIKFGLVGVSNVFISYVIYAVSLMILQKMGFFHPADYIIAQIFAFFLSVLWSFYWNNRLVFIAGEGKTRSIRKALVKTYISYSVTGLFVNSALLVLWVQVFHISEFIAPFMSLMISVPINFLMNKFWTFQDC